MFSRLPTVFAFVVGMAVAMPAFVNAEQPEQGGMQESPAQVDAQSVDSPAVIQSPAAEPAQAAVPATPSTTEAGGADSSAVAEGRNGNPATEGATVESASSPAPVQEVKAAPSAADGMGAAGSPTDPKQETASTAASSTADHPVAVERGVNDATQAAKPTASPVVAASSIPTAEKAAPLVDIEELRLHMDVTDARVVFAKDPDDSSSFNVTIEDGDRALRGRVAVIGSYTRRFDKKSLVVKLDDGFTWQGQHKIALDAMGTDESMMREWLTGNLIDSLGMVSPHYRYVRLYINNRFVGIFLRTDWIDQDMFVQRGAGGPKGQLFHPKDERFCGSLSPMDESDLEDCWFKFAPKDREFKALAKLVKEINKVSIEEFDRFLERRFDVDSVVNWLAVNILTSNADTYHKNYFLYLSDVSGKWIVIPWDYDMTFGRNWDPYLDFPANVYNSNFQYFFSPALGPNSVLKEKAMRNPEINFLLMQRLAHLMGLERHGTDASFGWFQPAAMAERVKRLGETLAVDAKADVYAPQSEESFWNAANVVLHYSRARYGYLKTTVFGRFGWDPEHVEWDPEKVKPAGPFPSRLYSIGSLDASANSTDIVADIYGLMLAHVDISQPHVGMDLSVEAEVNQPPAALPEGVNPSECVSRTWYVTLKSPFQAYEVDLTLDYLQENSRRKEFPDSVKEELLTLWMMRDGEWEKVHTRVNPAANTLTAKNLLLISEQMLRFVACHDQPLTSAVQ